METVIDVSSSCRSFLRSREVEAVNNTLAMRREFGYEIPQAPATLDGVAVFTRFLDGLAFRYYWATEGLRDEDYEFRPGPSSMSTKELLQHVMNLTLMIDQCSANAAVRESFESEDPAALRRKTLEILQRARGRIAGLDDRALAGHRVVRRDGSIWPVWNVMNGPLADALTHVGQINAWRRLNGNPVAPAAVFTGRPPESRSKD